MWAERGQEEKAGPFRKPALESHRLSTVPVDDLVRIWELPAEESRRQLSRQALALREALEAGDDLARPDVDQHMPVPTAVHRGTVLRARETGERRRGMP